MDNIVRLQTAMKLNLKKLVRKHAGMYTKICHMNDPSVWMEKTIHFDASDRLVWVKTVYQKPSWQKDYTIVYTILT